MADRSPFALAAVLALSSAALAQDTQALLPDDHQPFGHFGQRVAAADDLVVVSAPFADQGHQFNVGKLYVYEPDGQGGYDQTHTLTAPEPTLNAYLGQSLSTDGTRIVAGNRVTQPGFTESGAVDVFVRTDTGWVHEQRLAPTQPQENGRWGLSVAVHGEWLAVGAPHHDVPFENEGEVWMYRLTDTGWRLTDVLTAPNTSASLYFGLDLDLHERTLVVGTPAESDALFAEGDAHVFEVGPRGWTHVASLAPDDVQPFDQYGTSVAVHGGRIALSAPFADQHGNATGEVRVFQRLASGWERLDRVFAPDPAPDDHFGRALDLHGDLLAVSALAPPDLLTPGSGTVHLYRWNGSEFAHETSFPGPSGLFDAGYAESLEVSAGRILCGSPTDSQLLPLGGTAWLHVTP